jgi:hypothetical protein
MELGEVPRGFILPPCMSAFLPYSEAADEHLLISNLPLEQTTSFNGSQRARFRKRYLEMCLHAGRETTNMDRLPPTVSIM